jgi:hypothetical protein
MVMCQMSWHRPALASAFGGEAAELRREEHATLSSSDSDFTSPHGGTYVRAQLVASSPVLLVELPPSIHLYSYCCLYTPLSWARHRLEDAHAVKHSSRDEYICH